VLVAVFSHHLSCCWLHWEIRWKAGAANRNKERPSPLLGKGGTDYGVKELALFPPMAKLNMIDVNTKQLLQNAFSVLSIVSMHSICCFLLPPVLYMRPEVEEGSACNKGV
jgi:hypothetical protein